MIAVSSDRDKQKMGAKYRESVSPSAFSTKSSSIAIKALEIKVA